MNNNKINFFYFFIIIAAFSTVLTSCVDKSLSADTITENAEILQNQIEKELAGHVMGYSYVISHRGNPIIIDSGGHARNESDGLRAFHFTDEMHISHLSQFITSIATIRFLRDNKIDIDTEIHNFLPGWWIIGENVDKINFSDLLMHQSGFIRRGTQRPNAASIDSIRVMIASGSVSKPDKFISNQNYALMRILIPQILHSKSGVLGPIPMDIDYGIVFRDYLKQMIVPLAGLGSSDINTQVLSDNPILAYYSIHDSGFGYGGNWNFLLLSGAFGYVLDVVSMAAIWNTVWYENQLLNEDERKWVMSNRVGLTDSVTKGHVTYYIQSGTWTYASNQAGQQKRVETVAANFPNDWDIIIFTNSPHTDGKSLKDIAIKAFESI